AAETDRLTAEGPAILALDRPEVIGEKGSEAIRSAFYVQTFNEAFRRLSLHPRLLEPGFQLLGSDKLYMHQFKINAKAAFDGAVWQWHQDYGTWFEDDQMPGPRAMKIARFLAAASAFYGPRRLFSGCHRTGRLTAT